jgi:alpha,alpha-trehalose phosphorylase
MYLPYDAELGINPQDDSFLSKKPWDFANTPPGHKPLLLHYHPLHLYRHQVCKQADTVLAHFILEDYQNLSAMRGSYDFYEGITTHDSSLSACAFSIMAAKLGMPDKARDYFGTSAQMDLLDTHGNTKDGIHTANMGGAVMGIAYGFGGLRVKEDGLHLAPVLPKGWNGYSFRLRYEGVLMEVLVTADGCSVCAVGGGEVPASVFLEAVTKP